MERFLVANGKEEQYIHGMQYYCSVKLQMLNEFIGYCEKSGYCCAFSHGLLIFDGGDYAYIGGRWRGAVNTNIFRNTKHTPRDVCWRQEHVYVKLLCDLLLRRIYTNMTSFCEGVGRGYDIAMKSIMKIYKRFQSTQVVDLPVQLPPEIIHDISGYLGFEDEFVTYILPLIDVYFGAKGIKYPRDMNILVQTWDQFEEVVFGKK